MDITRELAIKILKYLDRNKDFYFPFTVMCKEYTPEDDDFVEIEPNEWEMIASDEDYRTFQLWENLQNLDVDTIRLMSKGFIEKIISDLSRAETRKTTFNITEDEIREVAEDIGVKKLSDKQVESILDCVEGDEMLAKDIRNSIIGSIKEVLYP